MKITGRSSAREVATHVAAALEDKGLRAVLSGGGCASIYTEGLYQSVDLDFILQGPGTQRELDEAMTSIGFARKGTQYFHALARYYVEFPPGPLGIGSDYRIEPVEVVSRGRRFRTSGPADSLTPISQRSRRTPEHAGGEASARDGDRRTRLHLRG